MLIEGMGLWEVGTQCLVTGLPAILLLPRGNAMRPLQVADTHSPLQSSGWHALHSLSWARKCTGSF